jgi:hypothetical protein
LFEAKTTGYGHRLFQLRGLKSHPTASFFENVPANQ